MADQDNERMRVEIVNLKAENFKLRKLRAEDAQFAEERLELAVAVAQNVDVADLEQRIMDLQKTLEEEGALVDRIVVYLRKKNS